MGLFRQKNIIRRLCRQSGHWQHLSQDGDVSWIATSGDRQRRRISVRTSGRLEMVKFSATFPIQFSLENPSSGLFARALLRNLNMTYASWSMEISGSCEAFIFLYAVMPKSALDAKLFHAICEEMHNEIIEFQQELNSKFRYDLARPVAGSYSPPRPEAGMHYLEASPDSISDQIRNRVIGGPKSLPKG